MTAVRQLSVPVLAFFLVSCDSQELNSLLERQDYYTRNLETYRGRVEKAKEKLEELKAELESAKESAAPSLKSISSREAGLAEMRESINQLAGLESALRDKGTLLGAYRGAFIEKVLPAGTPLGDIALVDGTMLKGATVRGSLNGLVKISHSGGFSDIEVAKLPESLRSAYSVRPNDDYNDVDVAAVIGNKPASLMSNEEYRSNVERKFASIEAAKVEESARRKAELEAKAASQREARLQAEADQAMKDAKIAEYKAKVDAYDRQISQLYEAIVSQEQQKEVTLSNARTGSIRVAPADLAKMGVPFDEKIAQLRSQIVKLQQEKSSIPAP